MNSNLPYKLSFWALFKFWFFARHNMWHCRSFDSKGVSIRKLVFFKGRYYSISIRENKMPEHEAE